MSNVGPEVTGLDKPRWTLTLVDDKGATYGLQIGQPRPLEANQTYVRAVGGQQVFVVKRDFAEDLRRPLSDYRSKSIVDLRTDQVESVKVAGKEKFELSGQERRLVDRLRRRWAEPTPRSPSLVEKFPAWT